VLSLFGFVLCLSYSACKTRDWKRATLPMAYMLEVALVGMLVLVPLIYTEALPRATLSGMLLAPTPPPAAPLPNGNKSIRPIRRISQRELLTTPVKVPNIIAVIADQPQVAPEAPETGVVGVVPGSLPGGTGMVPYGIGLIGPPPPTSGTSGVSTTEPARIRIGGQVEAAKLILQVKPEYPVLAKMARIQGVVRLEAVISKDGLFRT